MERSAVVLLTTVYAFTALTFVLVYPGGTLLPGEKISPAAASGVAAILLSLYLISQHNA